MNSTSNPKSKLSEEFVEAIQKVFEEGSVNSYESDSDRDDSDLEMGRMRVRTGVVTPCTFRMRKSNNLTRAVTTIVTKNGTRSSLFRICRDQAAVAHWQPLTRTVSLTQPKAPYRLAAKEGERVGNRMTNRAKKARHTPALARNPAGDLQSRNENDQSEQKSTRPRFS